MNIFYKYRLLNKTIIVISLPKFMIGFEHVFLVSISGFFSLFLSLFFCVCKSQSNLILDFFLSFSHSLAYCNLYFQSKLIRVEDAVMNILFIRPKQKNLYKKSNRINFCCLLLTVVIHFSKKYSLNFRKTNKITSMRRKHTLTKEEKETSLVQNFNFLIYYH